MRFATLAFAAAVLVAAPVFAQTEPVIPPAPVAAETTSQAPTSAQGETSENVDAGNDPNEEICRTVQRTESRLRSRRERVCATRAEWEQMQRDAQNAVTGAGVQSRRD